MPRDNVDAARDLRQRLTEAELVLWEALRDRRLDGLKFRRQHPVGPFVLDFCCADLRLGVELDGSVHENRVEADRERQALLEANGYVLLRFRNEEALRRLPDVLERIRTAANRCRSMRDPAAANQH